MADPQFLLTREYIDTYLQQKQGTGISPSAVKKYRTPLNALQQWLGEDKTLSAERLQAWRKHIEAQGYSKVTVQNYVKTVNNFLRAIGLETMCIPRPIRNDLTGQTFGYLTILEPIEERKGRNLVWKCACKCGNITYVPTALLLSGRTSSCGCLKEEILDYHNGRIDGTDLSKALDDTVFNPNSVSGYVGVYLSRGKWEAYITYKKKRYYLGSYNNKEDAIKARTRAKELVMEDAQRLQELLELQKHEHPSKAIKKRA